MSRFALVFCALMLFAVIAAGPHEPTWGSEPAAVQPIAHMGLAGTLLFGPAKTTPETVAKFVEVAGGAEAHVAIVALQLKSATVQAWREQFLAAKVKQAKVLTTLQAVKPGALDGVNGICLVDTVKLPPGLDKLLQEKLHSGGVVGIAGKGIEELGADGWGLLPGGIVKTEKAATGRKTLDTALHAQPGHFGMLLTGDPTVLVRGREIRQLGLGSVKFVLPASSNRPERVEALNPQGIEDLTLWRRAAVARTQPAFPPERPGVPNVPHGALVIVGGGGMPEDVTKKFIELAGGPDAPIVVLPTSMPDPLPLDTGNSFFTRYGAKRVKVLNARQKHEVEAPENLAALREAKAIWFGGGRQWRFVDAYEGTAAYELIHDVLRRGGVIGGSSAGATIQGEYLVRGSPHGPHVMMCEGYEQGFAFLPGVAIDQHFAQRKRFADMTAFMRAYPQYLGLGLDEATAIVVQGELATVMGRGQLHVYDRQRIAADAMPDYQSYAVGTRFNLKTRSVVPQSNGKE